MPRHGLPPSGRWPWISAWRRITDSISPKRPVGGGGRRVQRSEPARHVGSRDRGDGAAAKRRQDLIGKIRPIDREGPRLPDARVVAKGRLGDRLENRFSAAGRRGVRVNVNRNGGHECFSRTFQADRASRGPSMAVSTALGVALVPGRNRGMVFHMKTTLNIDDSVMQRLREEAARRGTTMSALVEAGLRRVLAEPEAARQSENLPPLPSWNGGAELVDISDRQALYRAMEEE